LRAGGIEGKKCIHGALTGRRGQIVPLRDAIGNQKEEGKYITKKGRPAPSRTGKKQSRRAQSRKENHVIEPSKAFRRSKGAEKKKKVLTVNLVSPRISSSENQQPTLKDFLI